MSRSNVTLVVGLHLGARILDVFRGSRHIGQVSARALGCGILLSGAERHIFRFEEKPKDPKLLDELRISPNLLKEVGRPPIPSSTRPRWASMSLIAKS
jgi:hypothetical protein